MEDMFYAIIGLAFIITLAVLAQKRRNKHFTKKCPKCGYPTVHPKLQGLNTQVGVLVMIINVLNADISSITNLLTI